MTYSGAMPTEDVARAALAAARDVVVAARCAGCRRAGAWLCLGCRDGIEPVRALLPGGMEVLAAGRYEGSLASAIQRFKYRAEPALARELGALVALAVARAVSTGFTAHALVPVALHPA
ncbi:MAG: ComF family protein, partial [Deltaproteobacteria bacterium]|nr:ComF family protein [Deltaproteobacteria bacterium]